MIGYSCKYAPVELVAAYGEEALLLDAETSDFSRAETLTHANVCCHAKALLTQALDTDELVLTDCCDATRRICDVLQDAGRQRFLFQFDLPHDDAACARARLTRELIRFADAYGAYTGRAFSKEAFFAACRNHSSAHPPRDRRRKRRCGLRQRRWRQRPHCGRRPGCRAAGVFRGQARRTD